MQPIKKSQRTESAVNLVDLANELEELEKEISEVERRIETETEWESLAQFLSEKEGLERRWEELYSLMNSK